MSDEVVSPDPSLRLSQIRERCKEWLAVGGFWNPNLMDGAKTRELICDLDAVVSDLIRRAQALREERDAAIRLHEYEMQHAKAAEDRADALRAENEQLRVQLKGASS